MRKAISSDLRERIVRGVRRAMAARFEVVLSTAVRVEARYRTTGAVVPARQGRIGSLADYASHRRGGERVSTAHVESTVNQMINQCMRKKRQMR